MLQMAREGSEEGEPTVVQAELHQSEAPQFKDLYAGVLHVIRGHVYGQERQVRGPAPLQQAIEPACEGVLQADAQPLHHLTNQIICSLSLLLLLVRYFNGVQDPDTYKQLQARRGMLRLAKAPMCISLDHNGSPTKWGWMQHDMLDLTTMCCSSHLSCRESCMSRRSS
jgi:hypothetical protein